MIERGDIEALPGNVPTYAPFPFRRWSKHRAGRRPKLTRDQRRKRDQITRLATQARKHAWLELQADARALEAAMSGDSIAGD